jgi:hypothetical protein
MKKKKKSGKKPKKKVPKKKIRKGRTRPQRGRKAKKKKGRARSRKPAPETSLKTSAAPTTGPKYVITVKAGLENLLLTELGEERPHDFREAPTRDHIAGTELVTQWVLIGPKDAAIDLAYDNGRGGKVALATNSKIPDETGRFEDGVVFNVP